MALPERLAQLTPSEVERRVPVWTALTEVFLDTELQGLEHAWIAKRIAAAGFTAEQAEDILLREVLPVFGPNLLSPAGEWTFWPEDFVRERMLDPEAWPGPFAGKLLMRLFRIRTHVLDGDWRKIRAHLA